MSVALYTVSQIRQLEQQAMAAGISEQCLMETAGTAAFAIIQKLYPHLQSMLVVTGAGNNAGDGYVVARLALEHGIKVQLIHLVPPQQLSGAALVAAQAASAANVPMQEFDKSTPWHAEVIVDAVLGTGLQREITGVFRDCIEKINQASIPVIALDIPSGIIADTGHVAGCAVRARYTITFIGEKIGFYFAQGPAHCGEIYIDDLHLTKDLFEKMTPEVIRLTWPLHNAALACRHQDSHKGDFGHVLVVGGDLGMPGAVRLCAEAAARVGAGLVSVATQPLHAASFVATRPEIMSRGITTEQELQPLLQRATVIALGPGLGQNPWGQTLWQAVLLSTLPTVVDADALNWLAKYPIKKENWILTPHPGEAARLLGCSVEDIQAERLQAVQTIVKRYGGVCVLKGAGTLIASATKPVAVCCFGNPGMASGGMGDVLTGVIAGLLAQKVSLVDAARIGVMVHALAADHAASDGERGLLALDLMPWLRRVVNEND